MFVAVDVSACGVVVTDIVVLDRTVVVFLPRVVFTCVGRVV